MKKILKRIFFALIIILALIILILFIKSKTKKQILFEYNYTNNAWEHHENGFIIYTDGTIGKYDIPTEYTKKDKISKKELEQLKKLASEVEDEYTESNTKWAIYDIGSRESKVYSYKESKYIILYFYNGTIEGYNRTETAEKILDLTDELYNKYLGDE